MQSWVMTPLRSHVGISWLITSGTPVSFIKLQQRLTLRRGNPNYKKRNPNPWVSSSNPRTTNSTTLKNFLLEIAVVYIEKFLLINENHIWIYISCIELIFLVPLKSNMHDIIINFLFYFSYSFFVIYQDHLHSHSWMILKLFITLFNYKFIIIIFYIAQVRHTGCPDDREWSEIANKCFKFFHNM